MIIPSLPFIQLTRSSNMYNIRFIFLFLKRIKWLLIPLSIDFYTLGIVKI